MSLQIESPSGPVATGFQELALLDELKGLLTVVIHSLSRGEPDSVADVSRQIDIAADQVMASSLNLSRLPLTPEAQQQRKRLLAELRQQSTFCRAMLRRWRRSIHLRQQLLGLAAEPVIYTESVDRRWQLS